MKPRKTHYLCMFLIIFLIVVTTGCSKTEKKATSSLSTSEQKSNIATNNESSGSNTSISCDIQPVPAQGTQSSQAAQPTQNAQVAQPVQAAQPAKAANSTQVAQPTESTQAAQPTQATQATQPSQTKQSDQTAEATQPAQQAQPAQTTQPVQTTPVQTTQPPAQTTPVQKKSTVTLIGFLQDEDCFVQYIDPDTGKVKEDPGDDTKNCLLMEACANSGFGITVKQSDGTYKFYYFDGNFAKGKKQSFTPGTVAQALAWQLIQNTKKQDHVTITVTGTLDGSTRTNTNAAFPVNQDGREYPVITVSQLAEN